MTKKPQNRVGPRAPYCPGKPQSMEREAETAAVRKPMRRVRTSPKSHGRKAKR